MRLSIRIPYFPYLASPIYSPNIRTRTHLLSTTFFLLSFFR